MSPLEEMMAFVRKVSLLRRAQRRYGTRQVGTTLAEVRKLEQEVDDLVTHLVAAPIPVTAELTVLPIPDSALPPLPGNWEAVPPIPHPADELPELPGLEQPQQPAERTTDDAAEQLPPAARRRRGRNTE